MQCTGVHASASDSESAFGAIDGGACVADNHLQATDDGTAVAISTRSSHRFGSFSEQALACLIKSDAGKLVKTLRLICRIQGVQGLYAGFYLHLLHTTLRGATSMALKERLVSLLTSHFSSQ